jgi:hypothetical protein
MMLSLPLPAGLLTDYINWLTYVIDLHPLLGADKVIADVMVAGHYHTYCF